MSLILNVEEKNIPIVLMDCIINEIYSVIARRSNQRGYSFKEAVKKMEMVVNSIEVVRAYSMVKTLHESFNHKLSTFIF